MTSKKSNKIETVNLANKRTSDDYAKIAPRAYRALHQLHAKVNKDSPASVSNTKPSFSYKMDEEPSLTLLDHSGASSKANEGPSSDYESGWMDDLPSPSDLLQAHGGNESVLEEISADREGPSSQALRSDPGDLEIGLGRNAEEQQTDDSTIFADNEYDEAMENIGPVEGEEASRYFAGGLSSCTAKETSPQKLFMSTDSPEKPSSPARKRRHSPASEPDPDDVKSVPEAKRGKLDEDCAGNDVPPSPIKGDDGPVPAVQTIKPGYPDWVYEFDPAFVAEWEPYVEFV